MAEAEYRRFTVARDCQKKNTSENHWSLANQADSQRGTTGGCGTEGAAAGHGGVGRVRAGVGARGGAAAAHSSRCDRAVCILSDFPMYFSFGSPAQQ